MAAEKEDEAAAEEHIDICSDANAEEARQRLEAEADALYNDVLTGSVDSEVALKKQEYQEEMKAEGGAGNHYAVYIGNFTWWMSDRDLITTAGKHGVKDIVKIKFAENRTNGQSKGYAKMVVSTEESLKRLLESMPQCKINGEKVECRHVSQRTLAEFETQARKRIPLRLSPKGDSERVETRSPSTSCPSHLQAPPPALMFPPAKPPPLIPSFYNTPPPPLPIPPPPLFSTPPPLFHAPPPHTLIPNAHAQHTHTYSLHINPRFLPPVPVTHNNTSTSSSSNNNNNRRVLSQPGDADFEELINRNRTIASSAITKAMSAATSGDIRMAIETLYTATAVIKQSRVFYDKRCRMLVESLNDCLNSIETKCFPSSKRQRSQERARSRSRDRYRERSSSTDRERERERERGRDREHRNRH